MNHLDEIISQTRSIYDTLGYECRAHRETHPDRLAVEAALRGIRAPAVEGCRVLEIGCANGGNLIPMAEQLPQSSFVGVDLSSRQIQAGLDVAAELGLKNLELRSQDLMEFPKDAGMFDYIIAHGFYAWVPPPVQKRLLEICRDHLSPRGVAFISYNTYPGSRLTEIGREMMLFHSRHATDPMERAARGRAMIRFAAEQTPNTHAYREVLRNLLRDVWKESDFQLLHDKMAVIFDPQYFWMFIEQAKAHGLGYISDVSGVQSPWFEINPSLRDMILKLSADEVDREQYLDFLTRRSFRSSLLCHAEALPAREPSALERLGGMHVAGNPTESSGGNGVQGVAIFDFAPGKSKIHVSNPRAIALLRHIRSAWPAALSFAEIQKYMATESTATASAPSTPEELAHLIELYGRMGLIELWPRSTRSIASSVNLRPRTTGFARLQATRDNSATSLRHEGIALDNAFRQMILLLDGTRDVKALTEELLRRKENEVGGNWPAKSPEHLQQIVEGVLKHMAKCSLLMNDES